MTLIELIVAIVIINIGLVGVMLTFTATNKASAYPMIYKQMSAMAEGMLEEILLKPFTPSANAVPANSCARDAFNDVRDYSTYSTVNACDVSGTPVAALTGYAVSVNVTAPASSPLTGIPVADVLKIKINVSHGTESYSLTGWRTCYGGPPC